MTPLFENARIRVEIFIIIIWKYKNWSWEKDLVQIGCTLFGLFSPVKFNSSVLYRQDLYSFTRGKDSTILNGKTVGFHLTWKWKQHRKGGQISSCHIFVKKARPEAKSSSREISSFRQKFTKREVSWIIQPSYAPFPYSSSRISQLII